MARIYLDLNINENVWTDLSRRIYMSERQFSDVKELKETVIKNWILLQAERIKSDIK